MKFVKKMRMVKLVETEVKQQDILWRKKKNTSNVDVNNKTFWESA